MSNKAIEVKNRERFCEWAAIAFAMVLPTLVTLFYFVWAGSLAPKVQQIIYATAKTAQFCFPVIWVCLVRKRWPQLWPWTTRGIGLGIVFGMVVAVAMFTLYHGWLKTSHLNVLLEKAVRQKISGLALNKESFIALAIFYSLIHSLLEEYYFRWFVFGQLKTLVRIWPAMLISSLCFMTHHVLVLGKFFGFFSLATYFFSLSIALGGMAWACLYERSGSLLGPWLSHLLVDAAIFAIGYEIIQNLLSN